MTLVINSKDAKGASSPVLEVSLVHASTKFLSFNTAVQLAYNFYLGRCWMIMNWSWSFRWDKKEKKCLRSSTTLNIRFTSHCQYWYICPTFDDGEQIQPIVDHETMYKAVQETIKSGRGIGLLCKQNVDTPFSPVVACSRLDNWLAGMIPCPGIFPEGGSHDQTKILDLKNGIAKISLATMSKYQDLNVKIIPVGLNYYRGHRFVVRTSKLSSIASCLLSPWLVSAVFVETCTWNSASRSPYAKIWSPCHVCHGLHMSCPREAHPPTHCPCLSCRFKENPKPACTKLMQQITEVGISSFWLMIATHNSTSLRAFQFCFWCAMGGRAAEQDIQYRVRPRDRDCSKCLWKLRTATRSASSAPCVACTCRSNRIVFTNL